MEAHSIDHAAGASVASRQPEPDSLLGEFLFALRRVAFVSMLLLPAVLTVYLAFNAGGFFPDTTGFAAAVMLTLLAIRLLGAREPLASVSAWHVVVLAGLAGLALWTLASAAWSGAEARALIEFDRVLLYLAVFAFFATVPKEAEWLRWMLRSLALGIVVVAGIAFITRALPEVWSISAPQERLDYPLTYWNALGLFVACGTVLCLHLGSDAREPRAVRVLAAAAIPLLGATLLLTFSRGSILVAAVGTVAYLIIARARPSLSTLVAVAPGLVFALLAAYDAEALSSVTPTSNVAVDQGRDLAFTILACTILTAALRAVLLAFDERIERVRLPARSRGLWIAGAVAATAVAAVFVAQAPFVDQVRDDIDGFFDGETVGSVDPREGTRDRLSVISLSDRGDPLEVAIDRFRDESLTGAGAGTFATLWTQDRPTSSAAQDAHSLYLETLAELGVVGAALLLVALLTMVAGLAARARGPERPLYAVVLVVLGMWMVHAGFDWDWEVPALAVGIFAVAASALARPPAAGRGTPLLARPALALGLLALAVVPMLVAQSQAHIDEANLALNRNDCRGAVYAAGAAIDTVDIRPEPHQIRGFCWIAEGRAGAALEEMRAAVALDPDNWEYRQAVAVAVAARGQDPRQELAVAHSLNPLQQGYGTLSGGLEVEDPAKLRQRARTIAAQLRALLG